MPEKTNGRMPRSTRNRKMKSGRRNNIHCARESRVSHRITMRSERKRMKELLARCEWLDIGCFGFPKTENNCHCNDDCWIFITVFPIFMAFVVCGVRVCVRTGIMLLLPAGDFGRTRARAPARPTLVRAACTIQCYIDSAFTR